MIFVFKILSKSQLIQEFVPHIINRDIKANRSQNKGPILFTMWFKMKNWKETIQNPN